MIGHWLAALLVAVPAVGCGGLSQNDMRKYAVRRTKNKDDDARSKNAKSGVAPQVAQPAAASKRSAPPVTGNAKKKIKAAMGQDAEVVGRTDDPTKGLKLPKKPDLTTKAARTTQSIENLRKLGTGLREFVKKNNHLPPDAIYSRDGRALLSWRVAMLPFVGEEELYKRFRLTEPWDSAHNKKLLPYIPMVYASPDRLDEKTNYMGIVGSSFAFTGNKKPRHVGAFEDGMRNTLALLEVNERAARPWTKPEDLRISRDPCTEVGKLRGSGFYCLWSNGRVGFIRNVIPAATLIKAMTVDAGDSFAFTEVHEDPQPLTDDGSAAGAARVAAAPTGAAGSRDGAGAIAKVPAPGGISTAPGARAGVPPAKRFNKPDPAKVRQNYQAFADLYKSRFEMEKTATERVILAKEMYEQAKQMTQDPAGQFALLQLARQTAARSGNLQLAMKTVDTAAKNFDMDPYSLRVEVMELLINKDLCDKSKLLVEADKLFEAAFERDDFDTATSMYSILHASARKQSNRTSYRELSMRRRKLELARAAYVKVKRTLDLLAQNPDDPKANLAGGRYYCFVKGQWKAGLRMLAKSEDKGLASVAEMDGGSFGNGAAALAVADQWWRLAEKERRFQRELRLRAVSHYLRALPQLATGIDRVKADVRIKEAARAYGQETIDKLRAELGA